MWQRTKNDGDFINLSKFLSCLWFKKFNICHSKSWFFQFWFLRIFLNFLFCQKCEKKFCRYCLKDYYKQEKIDELFDQQVKEYDHEYVLKPFSFIIFFYYLIDFGCEWIVGDVQCAAIYRDWRQIQQMNEWIFWFLLIVFPQNLKTIVWKTFGIKVRLKVFFLVFTQLLEWQLLNNCPNKFFYCKFFFWRDFWHSKTCEKIWRILCFVV